MKYLPLGELYPDIRNGFVGTVTPFFSNKENGVLYLRGTNVHDGVISNEDVVYVSKEFHEKHNRNLLGGLYRENPVKSRNYEAVKSSKKWENVGNSYIIPALLLYRYSYI